ncbi:protein kinase domain-containing protein [Hamiltosporidium magnivora]|uniref:cAMP-dependent protein kinase n=1 Tax=Hamiltosporidium magnivora TaxID=148818 RepID=A0A4Q9LHA2_9MICR|nr:protein kinase domain-containing protein [Hamiltosporidium magnivora]
MGTFILKKDLTAIEKLGIGRFWQNYLVHFCGLNEDKNIFFEMRVMKKKKIIELNEEGCIKEEYKKRFAIRCMFLMNVISTFQDYEYLYYIQELPRGGFFYYYLRSSKKFTKEVSKFYFGEMVLGIQYLHSKGMFFRLLSPDNIMISLDGHIKLRFDFLNSIGMPFSEYEKNIEYIPIDYVRNKEFSIESDYWSLGIILFEMMVGSTPFAAKSYEKVVFKMLNDTINYPSFIDEETKDLLIRLLDKYKFRRIGHNYNDRYLIRTHQFFNGINWISLSQKKIRPPITIKVDPLADKKNGKKVSEMFTTDFKKGQTDGYGPMFRYYGTTIDKKIYKW